MATRFMSKTLSTAATGITLGLVLAATTTTSSASSNTADAFLLTPPAPPSNCSVRESRVADPEWPRGYYTITYASWRDNSGNEDGFIVEEWRRNQSGEWGLIWSNTTAPNVTTMMVDGSGPNYRVRVKAFNAAGESDWSNWGR